MTPLRRTAPPLALVPLPAAEDDVDPTDFEAVFTRYARYVGGIALRLLGRTDEVDDVVQDVFLKVIRHLGQLREPGALKGWLATTTVRQAGRALYRRRFRALLGLDRAPAHDDVAATGATAEDRVLLRQVYKVLDDLPVAERLAWTLRHVEGEPLEVVAQRCGCSLATAKRRIAAAHEVMERTLADE